MVELLSEWLVELLQTTALMVLVFEGLRYTVSVRVRIRRVQSKKHDVNHVFKIYRESGSGGR
jgi:hypothetical protein